jgi:hypothetical protein
MLIYSEMVPVNLFDQVGVSGQEEGGRGGWKVR